MSNQNNHQVLFNVSQGVATLRLNRAGKHNAFDDAMIQKLIECMLKCREDSSVRVLVLSAEGKHFSAGADLAWMKRMANCSYEDNLSDAKELAKLMKTLKDLPFPTIAKVQGAAYGGAIGLISCCDIAIASEQARFSLSEVKLGLAPATIGPHVIAALGARRCRQLFITGQVFNASDALAWGLLHEVVPQEDLDSHSEHVVSSILANGPQACMAAKNLIASVEAAADLCHETSEMIANLRVSAEGQEGLAAFFEKRLPDWHPSH